MLMPTIQTQFVNPPSRTRHFDWRAVDLDRTARGSPIGWGRTEAEAIRDLIEQMEASA